MQNVGGDYANGDIHRILGKFWSENSVPHCDLLETFRQHKSGRLVLNKYDSHPSAEANRIAAEAIGKFIFPQIWKSGFSPEDMRR